ncbi:uncharacterized protein DS421_10g301930 [Arachis hypogaea]|nr:uncharacterized protein DS421_10g301930 [Arachis hypogaea]
MEFNSSYDRTNFMGYYPPSPISNGGWEYHQEDTNSEHSNPWRFASEPQDEQENFEEYQPPPQNDSYHYPHGGWEYQQGMKEYEQSSEMNYFPEPQSDSYYYGTYTKDGWEGKCNDSHSNYLRTLSLDCAARAYLEECSSFDYASTQNSLQDPYNSSHQPQNYSQPLSFELVAEDPLQKSRELLERQEQIMEEQKQRWTEQEFFLKKTEGHVEQRKIHSGSPSVKDEEQSVSEEEEEEVPISIEISMEEEQDEEATVSSELSMKNEVVENEIALEMTREHEDSQLSQTFLTQQLSTIKSVIEKYEEEMKKCWEDQQTSSIKKLSSQMLSAREEVEEQESEKDIQEESHSSEAEKCKEEKLMEPQMQEALNEEITPIITQQPSLESKEVKATSKNTNSVPNPESKINQAICKRKLAEERPRQGTLAESFPPLRSFLLTNWKKRKKVKNNMSS